MADCKACGAWFSSTAKTEICPTCERALKRLNGYAVPVVHGRWIKHWCDNSMIGHEFEECSECGCSMLDTNQFWDCPNCPNCGAHMGEDVADE